jgi:putative MATE family efflux protein
MSRGLLLIMAIIRSKKFYLAIVTLALPIALQDLIKFSIALVDNIMVGRLSEIDLSAVSLANQPMFLFSMMSWGLVCGGTVMITQYHGKKDYKSINKIISIILTIALCFSCAFALTNFLFPNYIMKIYTHDPEIISHGVEYIKIISWTYLLYGISNSMILILRSLKFTQVTLLINFIAFILNIFLDWILIFGKFSAPAMGIRGAAIATLIARTFEAVLVICYTVCFKKIISINLKKMFHLDKILLRDFFKYGIPVFVNEFLWSLGISSFAVILGHIGTEATAAWSITSSIEQFAFIPIYGVASAANIVIGNEIGKGNMKQAKSMSSTLLIVAVVFGIFLGLILFLSRNFIIGLYNIKEATALLAKNFSLLSSILIFIDAINLISIVGILRGGGDTKFAMYIDTLPLWLISIPMGLINVYLLHLPVIVTLVLLRLDIVIRSIFCIWRFKSNKWMINLTR